MQHSSHQLGVLTHCIIASLDDTRSQPPLPMAHEFASYPMRPLSSHPPLLGAEQLAHVRGHFDRVDVDGKGEIPVADLAPTLSAALQVPLPIAARCASHVMANGVPGESEAVSWGCAGLSHYLYSARLVQALLDDKAEKEDMGMIDKALYFCFPDLQVRSGELGDFNERTFAFAITDGDGERSYGVCRRVLGVKCDRATGTFRVEPYGRAVFAVCIVTRQPWLAFFFQLVNVVASLALERSIGAALTFVARVTKLGTVPRGQTVTLAVPGEPPQSAALTRTVDDIDLLPLMSSLDASHCLAVFASVLFDRRVLLLSSNLERASLCVLALGELLRPFRWHHIFIPVLPAKWIDYTMAPMPYICAMHASSRAALEKYPLDDVVIVDLDDRSVAFFEDDLDLVPPARLSKLIHVVEKAIAAYHKSGAFDNAAVKQEFMRFFASMMTGYRDFLRVDEKKADEPLDGPLTCSLELDAFLATKKGKIRSFMDAFVLSQHFEQFIKQAEQPHLRDELFESLAADKTSRAKKLLKLPHTLSRTLRGHGTMIGGDKPGGYSTAPPAAAAAAGAAQGAPGEEVGAFQCTECTRSYTFEADLSIHMMKRHRGPDNADGTYQCSLCERSYTAPEDLAFHMKKRHEAYSSMPSMRTQASASATYNPFEERKSMHAGSGARIGTATLTSSPAPAPAPAPAAAEATHVPSATATFNKANDQYTFLPTQPLGAGAAVPAAAAAPAIKPPTEQYGFLPTGSDDSGAGAGGSGGAGGDAAEVLKLLGGAVDGKKLVRRSGTLRKLNLAAGQQLVPTDDDGGVLAKAAASEGDDEADVIDEREDELPDKPMDKDAKRAARQSVFVQRNAKQIVLTVDVPFYGMSKKLSFNPEHKISHVVSQITDTAFFQQTRKANQKTSGRVENVQYALHLKKEVAGHSKTVRMSNTQQLLEFNLSDGDRVILLEVRLPPTTGGGLLTIPTASSTPSTPTAAAPPASTDEPSAATATTPTAAVATQTWGATQRPMTSPRGALLGSSRSTRALPVTTAAAAAATTVAAAAAVASPAQAMSPVVSTPEEKKRPELPHKNATVLAQKYKTGMYTTTDLKAATAAAAAAATAAASSSTTPPSTTPREDHDYDSFDPAMRMAPTVKLRAIVGDNPDDMSFVGVTLKQRDKIAKCMEFVMAGCDALLPEAPERADQYALFKRRKDGSFVQLPGDVILAAASLTDGDAIFVRPSGDAKPAGSAERNDTSGSADSAISNASVSTSHSGGTRSGANSGAAFDPFQTMVDELDDIVAATTLAERSERKDSTESTGSTGSGGGGGGGMTMEDAAAKKPVLPRQSSSGGAYSTYGSIPSSATINSIVTKIERHDDADTAPPAAAAAAAATTTTPPKTKRARIAKKVVVDVPLCDVWAKVGDFFDLRWTGVDKCELLTSDAAAAAGVVSIGGDAAAMLASSTAQKTAPVGELREFRHSGSSRAIRHRCVAFKKPTAQMLQRPTGLLAAGAAGVDSCGYAYELAVESALVPRMPVCAYASELKLRPSVSSGGRASTTVEWTATIVVRDEKVIDAVSEEIEKSLELLKHLKASE